jgi:hypothetical protein
MTVMTPDWSDAETTVAAAIARVETDLQACQTTKKPLRIEIFVSLDKKTGASHVGMPLPATVGSAGSRPRSGA